MMKGEIVVPPFYYYSKTMQKKSKKIESLIKRILSAFIPHSKYFWALRYWRLKYREEGGRFFHSHYQKLMLSMAGEKGDSFTSGKVIADFGCGPRGSLLWARSAKERIGIDVLADAYRRKFDLDDQSMRYVQSSESHIPLEDDSVDILFTMNAMDHIDNIDLICEEIIRVIKPGGLFVGSFNLDEPPTETEPQTLTEEIVKFNLLNHLIIESYRISGKGPAGKTYSYFSIPHKPPLSGPRILWVRAKKPALNEK